MIKIQQTLVSFGQPITNTRKATQRQVIFDMLAIKPCHCGEFMRKGIAQYNARIKELRHLGYNIVYDSNFKVFRLEHNEKL